MLPKLNFPPFQFRFKNKENKMLIFADLRKKFVRLTPEEWVRQHTIRYLIHHKKYPPTMLNAERQIFVGQSPRRYDVVAFKSDGKIKLVVECKAPQVKLTQETFDQIAQYNLTLDADYLMVTNGIHHYFCQLDYQNKVYIFLRELPDY